MTTLPPSVPSVRGAVDLSALVNRPAPGAQSAPAAPAGEAVGSVASLVLPVTDATFSSVLDLSSRVPVIFEFYAPGIEPSLGPLVEQYGGRLVLATVDGQANPQLAQAFQVTAVPTVVAVVGGRPLHLFDDIRSREEVRAIFDQVLQLAAQEGVTGHLDVAAPGAEPAEPVEEPLPPLHQEAYDAITAGDFALAISKYRTAIAQNPRDALAVAGLAQVSLLARMDGADAGAIRSAAASAPHSAAAQLAVADLDVSGGHLEDAFSRLLDLFPSLDGEGREAVRTRLLEYFEIAGPDDERVAAARRRLAGLLY